MNRVEHRTTARRRKGAYHAMLLAGAAGLAAPVPGWAQSGESSAATALQRLLRGSGLKVTSADGTTVTVGPERARAMPGESLAARGGRNRGSSWGDEIVVTGTKIKGAPPVGATVKVYTKKEIDQTGAQTVEQFARNMTENFPSVGTLGAARGASGLQGVGNFYSGASFNLRGLGPGATLTLLNGHRMAPAGLSADFTDISVIPISAIDRVDVLTGGASAVYGADAVAGVVNVLLRRDFDGAEVTARSYLPTRGGGEQYGGSVAVGRSWDTGGFLAAYDFAHEKELLRSERDFIPTRAGVNFLTPRQTRHSLLLTGRQELSPSTSASVNLMRSNRRFELDSFLEGTPFAIDSHGRVRAFMINVAGRHEIAPRWSIDVSGNWSEISQNQTSTRYVVSTGVPAVIQKVTPDAGVGTVSALVSGAIRSPVGGDIRLAFGGEIKREEVERVNRQFNASNIQTAYSAVRFSRDVRSVFGEALLPITFAATRAGKPILQLSAALRWDDYSDFGSTFNPRIGAALEPIDGLVFRGSYATSFRAPILNDVFGPNTIVIQRLPNPAGGTISTLNMSGGNPDLKAETSTSYTLGVDYRPEWAPKLRLSVAYFNIKFGDRIARPPIIGSISNIYSQTQTLAPYFNLSPTPGEIALILGTPGAVVVDATGSGAAGVQAIFDNRTTNIARSVESGVDFDASYSQQFFGGELTLAGRLSYIIENSYMPATGVPATSVVDIYGGITDVRANGSIAWSSGGFRASATLRYIDGYRNPLFQPARPIDSWATVDAQIGYRVPDNAPKVLRGFDISLTAINIADRDPPEVHNNVPAADDGFDANNANPLGRVISLSLRKTF